METVKKISVSVISFAGAAIVSYYTNLIWLVWLLFAIGILGLLVGFFWKKIAVIFHDKELEKKVTDLENRLQALEEKYKKIPTVELKEWLDNG